MDRMGRGGIRLAARGAGALGGALLLALVLGLVAGPLVLPYRVMSVLSGSMEPAIGVGSLVVLRPIDATDIGAGDVITFARPDRPNETVTHRVVAIEGRGPDARFVTKGDANRVPDMWRVPATGRGWRLSLVIPVLGRLLWAMRSFPGRLVLVVAPLLALAAIGLVELWRPRPAVVL